MQLLQFGVDITVVALWLGHESPTTTQRYIEADLAMKRVRVGAARFSAQRSAARLPREL
jgi:integrase/recombinase XerD